MNYRFPTIKDISEVRTAIYGRPDFIEVQKHDYIVFNYVIATPDTFPKVEGWKNAMVRECRGLIFNLDGKVIRRPYHKFFNLGEREETFPENVLMTPINTVILEKLDGSMIAPFYSNGKIRWGTKMGITDLTNQVEKYLHDYHTFKGLLHNTNAYYKFAELVLKLNHTPIFEWCSNKNRIVLPYEEDKLTLTAIRDDVTGEYHSYNSLAKLGNEFDVPVVYYLDTWSEESVREAKGSEGIVVRFDDGHMLKVKSDWYVDLHKTKEAIQTERFVIKMIFTNMVDDILPKLQEDDVTKLLSYQKKVIKFFNEYVDTSDETAREIVKQFDRKTFAIAGAKFYSSDRRAFIFKRFDNPHLNAHEYFSELVIKKTGCNKNLKEVEHIYGYVRWDYNNDAGVV